MAQFSQKEKNVGKVILGIAALVASAYFGELYHPFGTADKIAVYAVDQIDQSSDNARINASLGYDAFSPNRDVYLVKKGDTLYDIAKEHGYEVEVIMFANNLEDTVILPGQKLDIPTKD